MILLTLDNGIPDCRYFGEHGGDPVPALHRNFRTDAKQVTSLLEEAVASWCRALAPADPDTELLRWTVAEMASDHHKEKAALLKEQQQPQAIFKDFVINL